MLNDYIFPLPCLIFLPQVAYLLQGYDLLIDQSPSDIRRAGLNKTRSNRTIGWSSQSLFLKRIPILLVFSAS